MSVDYQKKYREYYKQHKGSISLYRKEYYRRQRAEALEALGGQCVKCGFSDFRVLQIDHVNGDGNKERKTTTGFSNYFKKVISDTIGAYQLLCANCNWIKKYENNEI